MNSRYSITVRGIEYLGKYINQTELSTDVVFKAVATEHENAIEYSKKKQRRVERAELAIATVAG